MREEQRQILESLRGKIVVSCQALPDEPFHSSYIMGRMALAAMQGGVAGIRAQSKADILEISRMVELPIIGIVKRKYPDSDVYITPTKKEIVELLQTRCEIIAVDATLRKRPQGEALEDLLQLIHESGRLAMADCSVFAECEHAQKLGFDIISTTLCGYTAYSKLLAGPDFALLKQCHEQLDIPIFAEGKIHTCEDLRKVMHAAPIVLLSAGRSHVRKKLRSVL